MLVAFDTVVCCDSIVSRVPLKVNATLKSYVSPALDHGMSQKHAGLGLRASGELLAP